MAGVRHRKHSLEHWRQGGNPLICVVGHGGGFGFDSQRVMRSGRVLSKRIAWAEDTRTKDLIYNAHRLYHGPDTYTSQASFVKTSVLLFQEWKWIDLLVWDNRLENALGLPLSMLWQVNLLWSKRFSGKIISGPGHHPLAPAGFHKYCLPKCFLLNWQQNLKLWMDQVWWCQTEEEQRWELFWSHSSGFHNECWILSFGGKEGEQSPIYERKNISN